MRNLSNSNSNKKVYLLVCNDFIMTGIEDVEGVFFSHNVQLIHWPAPTHADLHNVFIRYAEAPEHVLLLNQQPVSNCN